MKIGNIGQNQYNIHFNSWYRTVYNNEENKKSENIKHRNTTSFYRRDLDWPALAQHLVNKFDKEKKVNTYCYGCSNGSEPYSFLIQLCNDRPDFVTKKFFPIIAKDYDEEAIKIAQNGEISIGIDELSVIRNAINKSEEEYFQYTGEYNDNDPNCGMSWKVKYRPEHAKNIQFSVADIRDDYKNIEPKNSVIFARNFWPYLSKHDREILIENLSEHLEKGSCIIIGSFDNIWNIGTDLINNGFKPENYPLTNVYTKL